MDNHLQPLRISGGASFAVVSKEWEGLTRISYKEIAVSQVNHGAREMFKRKKDWTEERLRRLERPHQLPNHPPADRDQDVLSTEPEAATQVEI